MTAYKPCVYLLTSEKYIHISFRRFLHILSYPALTIFHEVINIWKPIDFFSWLSASESGWNRSSFVTRWTLCGSTITSMYCFMALNVAALSSACQHVETWHRGARERRQLCSWTPVQREYSLGLLDFLVPWFRQLTRCFKVCWRVAFEFLKIQRLKSEFSTKSWRRLSRKLHSPLPCTCHITFYEEDCQLKLIDD
jgi:hypothetical protein